MELVVHDRPDEASLVELEAALVGFNESVAPPEQYAPLAVLAREDERLLGGVSGFTHWDWLFIEHLWVDQEHRGHGIGAELLGAFEEAALSRGVSSARVSTFSFQAPDFYRSLGYREFAVLDSYPPGGQLHFFTKALRGEP